MWRRIAKIVGWAALGLLVLALGGIAYLYVRVTRGVVAEDPGTPSVIRYAEPPPGALEPAAERAPAEFELARFAEPGREFGPMTRWWWPGADVEPAELEREVAMFAENGFAGVEIQPFTMGLNADAAPDVRARVMEWDSDRFYSVLRGALDAAKKQGLIVDLNGGSGWPTGGPHIALSDNFRTLLHAELAVTGGAEREWTLEPPSAPLSAYVSWALAGTLGGERRGMHFPLAAELVAVTAARVVRDGRSRWIWDLTDQVELDPDSVVDLTSDVDGRTLTWTPPEGDWRVISFWSLPDGEAPALLAKTPSGFVVDHFDAPKVRANYDYLFGKRTGLEPYYGDPLRAIFNDSYEFKAERHFTRTFLDEFERRRGYDIRPWLPAVLRPGYNHMLMHMLFPHSEPDFVVTAEDWRIRHDYDQTLGELLAEGFLDTSADWTARRGMQHRTQAYGMPMDVIGASGRAQIPETEQLYWGGSEAFLKAVASGAWLYNRPVVTAESVVYMNREYMSTPQKIKISLDKAFTSGVNQAIYHGTAYQYESEGYPAEGWFPWSSPYMPFVGFSTDLRETNPFWKFVPQLNRYIARSQYALRSGRPSVDVLLYYPFLGFAMNEEVMNPEELLPRGEFVGVEPPPPPPGLGIPGADGDQAKTPQQVWLAQVWETINTLEELGVTWGWVNDESLLAATFADGQWRIRGNSFQAVVLSDVPFVPVATAERLSELAAEGATIGIVGAPPTQQPGFRDYAAQDGAVRDAMQLIASGAGVSTVADASGLRAWSAGIDRPIRYAEPYRFLRQIQRTTPSGGRIAFLRSKADKEMPVGIEVEANARPAYWLNPSDGSVTPLSGEPYALPAYGSVIVFAGAGPQPGVETSARPRGRAAESTVAEPGAWSLTINGSTGDQTPLGDWRGDPGTRYAAEGVYRAELDVPAVEADVRYILDLGRVSAVAEVTINGAAAGTALFEPYALDVTEHIAQGGNALEIRVIAPARNAILGKALAGDAGYSQFKGKEESTLPAGLFGPVQLRVAQ